MTVITCQRCGESLPAEYKFCGHCGASLRPSETGSAARDEFRDVTILFADVSGFTAMSERLDPEALHQLMNECFDGLGLVITEHGGHIDKYIGDSIMAVFGAPVAHDDDPERAGDAALAMQAFMRRFSDGLEARAGFGLKLRIGLHSGVVLAGGVGAEHRRDYSVMGDTVNTASRLEGAATPGSVLVSGEFRRRVATLFRFGPVRRLQLRGKAQPIEALELLGSVEESHADDAVDGLSPFIGREAYIGTLTAFLSDGAAEGAWLDVRGAIGIGKTRTVETAARRVPEAILVRLPSRPAATHRPYAIVRRIIQAIASEAGGRTGAPLDFDSFRARLQPLGAGLDAYLAALWFLAAPASLGLASPDPDPQSFRRTVDGGLRQLLANVARVWPRIVLFFDSYEHADSASRSALESIYGRGGRAPKAIAALRLEGEPSPQARHTVELQRFAPANAERFLTLLLHDAPLPAAVAHEILTRTEGVPLFIEEMAHTLVADGFVTPSEEDRPWTWTAKTATVTLPGTLLGTMAARLDRLEARERELLTQCAVQGLDFDRPVAASVWRERGGEAGSFETALANLERHRLIAPHTHDPRRWAFVQVLLQNAAYNAMLRKARKDLHRIVARALVDVGDPGTVGPETLADHYELAEDWVRAADMNLRAGDRAAALFANADALRRYQAAISACGRGNEAGEDCCAFAIGAHRGAALVHLRLGESSALEANAQAMLRVGRVTADKAEAMRLLAALMVHRGQLKNAEAALQEAQFLLDEAPHAADRDVRMRVLYDLADVEHRLGQRAAAAGHLAACRTLAPRGDTIAIRADLLAGRIAHTEGRFQDAVALYREAEAAAAQRGSLSELAQSLNALGNAARDMGDYEGALASFEKALEIWTKTGAAESIAGLHNNLANIAMSRGDAATAGDHYALALEAFSNIGHTVGTALARTNLAVLAIEKADFAEAVGLARDARQALLGTGDRILLGLTTVILGEALLSDGDAASAAGHFAWVLEEYDEASHPLAIAGAHRGHGRVALARQDFRPAREALDRALALYTRLAREQEAARTQVYLARALTTAGALDEARSVVAEACERFRNIGAERDLGEAAALAGEIERLASTRGADFSS